MKQFVIIVAGGKGVRMNAEIPKQFLLIHGKSILLHTLEKFKQALPQAELVLVLPDQEIGRWQEMAHETPFEMIRVTKGGENRFDSVKSGLSLVPSNSLVAIHDAVRPFVSVETIQRVFKVAAEKGSAIPAIKLKDSIRQLERNKSVAVDRGKFRLIQTPQCFQAEILKKAYEQKFDPSFTDDATVVESLGKGVELVSGNFENIKITTQEDLQIGAIFLS